MPQIDLEKLPEFAQAELEDFYQFLLQKYTKQTKMLDATNIPLAPRLVEPFVPLSRDAIYER